MSAVARDGYREAAREKRSQLHCQAQLQAFEGFLWKQSLSKVEQSILDMGMLLTSLWGKSSLPQIASIVCLFLRNRIADVINLFQHLTSVVQEFFQQCTQHPVDPLTEKAPTSVQNVGFFRCVKKFYVYAAALATHGLGAMSMDLHKELHDNQLDDVFKSMDFVGVLVSSGQFVFGRVGAFLKTRKWTTFFHSGNEYEKWGSAVQDVFLEAEKLKAFDCVIDRHGWLQKIKALIEQGEEMLSVMRSVRSSNSEISFVSSTLIRLQSVYVGIKAKVLGQQSRVQPFSVSYAGPSSAGKSTLIRMTHAHFQRVRGRKPSFATAFTVNADANFWDGFESSKTTIIMDDVAAHKENRVQEVDRSVCLVLQVSNTISMFPDMAALDDKGKNPLLADLFIMSTNVEDLGLKWYYNSPYAAARRLKYHVLVTVKPEYQNDLLGLEAEYSESSPVYPDFWLLTVRRAKPIARLGKPTQQDFELEEVATFSNIADYLRWMTGSIRAHFEDQAKVVLCEQRMLSFNGCSTCFLDAASCKCLNSDFIVNEEPVVLQSHTDYERDDPRHWRGFQMQMLEMLAQIFPYERGVSGELMWTNCALAFVRFFASTWLLILLFFSGFYWWLPLTWFCVNFDWLLCLGCQLNETLERYGSVASMFISGLQWAFAAFIHDSAKRMADIGSRVFKALGGTPLILALMAFLTAAGVYAFVARFFPGTEGQPSLQADFGEKVKKGDEPENVWKKPEFVYNIYDAPKLTRSLKGQSIEQIKRQLGLSLVTLHFTDGEKYVESNGFLLGGQFVLMTKHSFPMVEESICEMVCETRRTGATQNFTTMVSVRDVIAVDRELMIVQVVEMTPRKQIIDWIPETRCVEKYNGKAFLLYRKYTGELCVIEADCARMKHKRVNEEDFGLTWFFGGLSEITQLGQCGGLWFLQTEDGPMLVANHVALCGNEAIGIDLTSRTEWLKHHKDISNESIFPIPEAARIGKIGDLHPHAGTNYLESGYVESYGSLTGFRGDPRNSIVPTRIAPLLERDGFESTHAPAELKGYEFKKNHLVEFTTHTTLSPKLVDAVMSVMLEEWIENIPKAALAELRPLPQEDVMNGVEGIKYFDQLDLSTSAGAYHKVPKRQVVEFGPDGEKPFKLKPEVQTNVDALLARYERGEMGNMMFTASAKCEPRTHEKVKAKKTRVFMAGPVEMTVVMRMLYLSFVRMFYIHRDAFESAVGIDATSIEWDRLFKKLTAGDRRMIAGDFKGFDMAFVTRAFTRIFEMIILLYQLNGADPVILLMMRACARDIVFFMVDYFGEVIRVRGKNPSGQSMTVIVNCIFNSFLCRVAWILAHPEFKPEMPADELQRLCREFRPNVKLVTYGDDDVLGVNRSVGWFTHTSMSAALAQIGVVYTHADKTDGERDYVTQEELTFLKRGFRYEEELKAVVAPLDATSLLKNLFLRKVSGVLSEPQHLASKLRETQEGFFFHGRTEFDEWDARVRQYIVELGLGEYFIEQPLLSWDLLVERYHDATKRVDVWEKMISRKYPVLQCKMGRVERCSKCGKSGCRLKESDLRICSRCEHCRFEDWDLNCYHCGDNDICSLCLMPLIEFQGEFFCKKSACANFLTDDGKPICWSSDQIAYLLSTFRTQLAGE